MKKEATIYPINDADKCLQCAANREEIGRNSQRISKIKSFLNEYDWKGINYPSEKDNWTKFEKNNSANGLNVFLMFKILMFKKNM